jgi:alpha-ketoglutarate-dependent taurine dioxygenase
VETLLSLKVDPITPSFGIILSRADEKDQLPFGGTDIADLLRRYRCVIFRGFQATIEDFERLTAALTQDFLSYQGGGFTVGPFSRSTVNNNKTLLTATGKTQEFALPLHGEMYYLSRPPDLIWFYSAKPSSEGGETTIGDGVKIFNDLCGPTARLFEQRRIRYDRRLADGDWQVAFQTTDKKTVEEFCRMQALELTWEPDGSAITHFRCSALRSLENGNYAFINSLLLLALGEQALRSGQAALDVPEAKEMKPDFVVRWEDGTPIDLAILKEVGKISHRNEIPISWQPGDIVLVDNRSVMHGRRASVGRDRQILVRMGSLKPVSAAA